MIEEKCCCSNEKSGTIPILRIIQKLDSLFAKNNLQEAGRVLKYWESEARALNDKRGLAEILSEQVGFYRRTNDQMCGMSAVNELLELLDDMDIDNISTATMYLNCATTMKAFEKASEALVYYHKAQEIYQRTLEKDDFRLAGFFNNYATALADLKEFDKARECYLKAIEILKSKGVVGELAVTYVNLAHLEDSVAKECDIDNESKIEALLENAYNCLDDKGLQHDGNYAYICQKCAPSFAYFGYFLQKSELEKRANEIYCGNTI